MVNYRAFVNSGKVDSWSLVVCEVLVNSGLVDSPGSVVCPRVLVVLVVVVGPRAVIDSGVVLKFSHVDIC